MRVNLIRELLPVLLGGQVMLENFALFCKGRQSL